MGMQTVPYQNLPILSMSESMAEIVRFISEQFRARLETNPNTSLDEYGILNKVTEQEAGVIYSKNEVICVDEEFYAVINTAAFQTPQPWAFVGEDWFRVCWMIRGGADQELLPTGLARVPSSITPASLSMRPGHVDFELQTDQYVKVESLKVCGPMMWVSIAMSRRALQRMLGEMDSAIPLELDRYIYRDESILMMHRSPISAAGMKIVLSLFENPLTGRLRVLFQKNQIKSLLYVTLGNDWGSKNLGQSPNFAYKKMVEAAEMLRYQARTAAFNIDYVAKELGISRSFLDSHFRIVYGTTPGKFLIEEKMQYAAELLSKNDMPIKEIAHLLGYERHSSFTRCFGRHFGVSPIMYNARY